MRSLPLLARLTFSTLPGPSAPQLPFLAPVSSLAPTPAPPTLAPSLIPVPSAPEFRSTRDISRDEIADKLEAAGFPEELEAMGLTMWHVLSHKPRSGEQVHLTFGLPPEGRPFEHGGGDPARRAELARRVKEAEVRIIARAAEILGKDASAFVLHERLIEGCCGAGCQSCLLGNPERAKKWTGLERGPKR